jgi:DNA-binding transcriptional LysR family regulator
MRIFIAVADTGALNSAARRLEVSPSAVSKHIAALENKLGAQLLTRTTRQVALTEVGITYLESCQRIITELDKADSAANSASGSVQGVLHVGAPPGFAHRHVAPHLPIFLEEYPHLSVELQSTEADQDMIDAGFDLCIRISPHSDHDKLVYTELAPNSRRLLATPDYLAAHGAPLKPADLSGHRLITQTANSSANYWHFKDGNSHQTIHARGHLMMDSGDAMLRAVLNNGGIAMLPTYMTARHIRSGSLVTILDSLVMEDYPIHAVTLPNRHSIPKIEVFLQFLQSLYGDVPYWDALDAPPSAAALRATI